MKLLFCDNSLRELLNFRGDIIRHFVAKGYQVVLVAPRTDEYPIPEGCSYVETQLERCGMNPLHDLKYFWIVFNTYRREKPGFVFHYTIKPNIYGSISARILGIPSTAMVTGLGYVFNHNDFRSKIARRLYKLGLWASRKVIVLNEECRRVLLDKQIIPEDKLLFFDSGEGVNLDLYKP